MADEETYPHQLHWTGGWTLNPVWPHEPSTDIIKWLAKLYLGNELPIPFNEARLDIRFFAEGGFNKLYEISYLGHHTSSLLRATLPVVPYYKIESEVATIAFLRAHTTIPVPRILAWDSNEDNELTFEWILMEKLAGVPLFDLWPRKVPWERKLELTKTVAGMVKKMRNCKFDRIGGLYFKTAVAHTMDKPTTSEEMAPLVTNRPMKEGIETPMSQATKASVAP